MEGRQESSAAMAFKKAMDTLRPAPETAAGGSVRPEVRPQTDEEKKAEIAAARKAIDEIEPDSKI